MATIASLSEDFATGSVGATVAAGYGQVDAASGSGTSVIASDGIMGLRSVLVTTSASFRNLSFNNTAAGGWRQFGFKIDTTPNSNTAIASWYGSGTKGGDLRVNTDRTLTIRDSSSVARYSSTAVLAVDTWYLVSVRVNNNAGGGHYLKVYNATTGAIVIDSGAITSTGFTQATSDEFRLGLQSSSTGAVRFSRLRGDSTDEPATGFATGAPVLAMARSRVERLDFSGSNGTITVTQTSGTPAATITNVGSGIWEISVPSPLSSTLTFQATATDLGVSTSQSFTITPGAAKVVFTSNGTVFQ